MLKFSTFGVRQLRGRGGRSMRLRVCVAATLLWSAPALWTAPQAAGPRAPRTPQETASAPTGDRAALDKYCVTCHNERAKIAGLTLDKVDLANIPASADI